MIGTLPKSLVIDGREYRIRSDYRVILAIYEAFNDNRLSDIEKAYICVKSLFYEAIPDKDLQEAVNKAYWFVGGGDSKKSKEIKEKIFDWQYDETLLFPAINKVAGKEIREVKYLHWWTFLGYFSEIGDCTLSTVISIRKKRAEGKKLDDWERQICREYPEMINILTEEEKREIAETEAFIDRVFA